MAEIKIEKKKPIWPWVLGVLILLALVYFFWASNDGSDDIDDGVVIQDTTQTIIDERKDTNSDSTALYSGKYGTVVTEKAVSNYLTYIDNDNMGLDHEYTNGALIHLITATEAEANNLNVNITANLDKALENAAFIKKDPTSLAHADKIKNASMEIASALKTIQEQKFDNLIDQANEVKAAAEKIDIKTPTLDQKKDVKNFFERAGILLQKMEAAELNNQ